MLFELLEPYVPSILFSLIYTVELAAVGASLAPKIVIVIVAVSVAVPSETV